MTAERTTTRTIIAALPGWYVAIFIEGGEDNGTQWDDYFALQPVIAWEIERSESPYHPSARRPSWDRAISHTVIPLTPEGNYERHGNEWCIKTPDGKFDFVGDNTRDNEAEALAVCRSRADLHGEGRETA